ncbi:unnamed protein product [Prorocentrum cordatum]|uniref:Uncharacterized protein n=1 Tax=Prorocentrum cordatum TaxID=2364126 RepID=A0ABN9RPN9_9DINO|nr:unnamed protein product [Polarella glacialis]
MLPCASSRHIRVRVMILAPSRICSHVGKMRNAYNTTLETDTPYTFLRSAMNRLFLVGLLFRTSLAITSRHDARYEHESISSGMASEHLFFKKLGIEHAYGLRPTEFLAVMESSAEPSARTGGLALLSASESHEASCQDAQPGSMCYHAASWLQAEGLAKYPDWYPSLSADSTRQEVQAVLHTLGKADCPSPCISRVAKRLAQSLDERALEVDGTGRQVFSEAYELSEPTSCGDVVEGDWCSLSIQWLKNIGLESHPDWYPGLTRQSSIHDFQTVLHNSGKVGCKLPCSSIPQVMSTTTSDITQAVVSPSAMKINAELEECEVPREGSRCYNAIRNVMQVGLGAHPEEYPELSESSSREEVQEHLFLRRQYECGRPCPKDLVSKHSRHQRVKMNVADMTEHEMTMYLNHEWDGYVDGDEYGASAADNAFEAYPDAVAADGAAPAKRAPPAAEGVSPGEPPQPEASAAAEAPGGACRDAAAGELCYQAVTWARTVGIVQRPSWYPGLSPSSTFQEFQAHLHRTRGTLCTLPCLDSAGASAAPGRAAQPQEEAQTDPAGQDPALEPDLRRDGLFFHSVDPQESRPMPRDRFVIPSLFLTALGPGQGLQRPIIAKHLPPCFFRGQREKHATHVMKSMTQQREFDA